MADDKKANSDRVALWEVPTNSGLYSIEFEHGTTTGKRVLRVNGKVSTNFLLSISVVITDIVFF
jgi:hypothetical protein